MFKEIASGLYGYFPKTFSCNCYFIAAKKPVLIDTGLENQSPLLMDSLEALGYSVKDISMVLHTHGHADHIGASAMFRDSVQAMSAHDGKLVNNKDADFTVSGWFSQDSYPEIKKFYLKNEIIGIPPYKLRIIETPGHTAGSVSLLEVSQGWLFSGDTLFREGIGRHDLPSSDAMQLKDSLELLLETPYDLLLPGHGGIGAKDIVTIKKWIAHLEKEIL